MVTRILASFYRLGQDQVKNILPLDAHQITKYHQDFPPPNFDAQNPDGSGSLNLNVNVRTDAHTELVRKIAGASTVLLKNAKNTLPLSGRSIKSMAIIGLDAAQPLASCNLGECDTGVVTIGWASFSALCYSS